jgi:hypothetical protein
LAQLKGVEKKFYKLDRQIFFPKDLASTSRLNGLIDDGGGHEQLSLLGVGLRSKQSFTDSI